MGTQGTGRKRSTKKERSTAEDDALNLIAREAEARLAAKRAARAEAREIRMKELERQQKELSDDDERMSVGSRGSVRAEDRDYLEKGSRAASALTAGTLTSLGGTSSRRGSGETAITVDAETSIREIKDALAEVEEKYRKAMVSNAQLDNEKNNLMYQVDTLKDSLMELEELLSESRREYEEKVKEYEREKYAHGVLQFQFNEMKETLKQSEELLNEIRQLRMKQDGFAREISDLQETVEWKDKKIGALERQKEYTDAIRTERDELREEVVKLKDILKKHGIVLGPDLNINGDIGETDVDGSPSGDSAPQPAQDSQTSPTEGNSMLGNTEETQLRSSGEEEVDPEQHQEMLKEEVKENQLSSDTLCNVDDVSTLETSSEEQPTEQQQTCLPTEEDNVGDSGLSKDVDLNDRPITEAKDIIVCSSEPQEIVTSAEENIPEKEVPKGGELGETSNLDIGEAETKSSSVDTHGDDFRETHNKLFEEQEQEDTEVNNMRNTESCPQQKAVKDVKENLPHETISAVTNTAPQYEPDNMEEAENDEAEEISSKSQGATASGKKKKKKRRGKKKGGNQQKDGTDKENSKKEQDIESAKGDNGSTTEPNIDDSVTETLKESKMDQVKKEQDSQETEEVDAALAVETTETLTHEEEIKVVASTEILSLTETPTESLERETGEIVEAVGPTETSCHVETLKESRTEPTEAERDREQTLETEEVGKVEAITNPPEASLSTSDLTESCNSAESTDNLNKEGTYSVDNSVSGDISANGEAIHSESEMVDQVEGEVESECTDNNPENSLETNSKENTEAESQVPSNSDVAADESTNNSEGKDLTSVSPPYADDVTDYLKSSPDSEPPSGPFVARNSLSDDTPIMVSDGGPEEVTDTVQDEEEPEMETKQESFPSRECGNSELREPEDSAEPDSSSHNEKSDSALLPEITDELDAERSLLETVAKVEHLEDVESQTLECVEQTDESNAKVPLETDEINTVDVLNTADSPEQATDMGSSIEQDQSNEDSAVAEDPEHEISQNDKENEASLSPLAEQPHESSKENSEDDSSQPTKLDSDEEDGDNEEGQSFDFDDMDIEAAVTTNPPINQEQEEVEEGVEVMSDESNNSSSELCQSNTETNESTQNKPIESSDEKCMVDQADTRDKESDTMPLDNQNSLAPEEATADGAGHIIEEVEDLNVVESGAVAENVNQSSTSLPVEEGFDAVKHEMQGDDLVLPKSADQVASNKEPPQSGKDAKKNGKKGKGKGKEECKMS